MAYVDKDKLPLIFAKAIKEFDGLDVPLSEVAIKIGQTIRNLPTANVVEVKDCEKCEHFDKHSTQPICICCSNRYTNNFKPKRSDA